MATFTLDMELAMWSSSSPEGSPRDSDHAHSNAPTRQNSFVDEVVVDSLGNSGSEGEEIGKKSDKEDGCPFWHLLALAKEELPAVDDDVWPMGAKNRRHARDHSYMPKTERGIHKSRRGRSPGSLPARADPRLLSPDVDTGRQFNMAAEIRTYVRTLGPFLHLHNYRRLRSEVRRLGLRETDEALEFVRRYFTVDALSRAALPDHIDLRELSLCAQGAVLCERKLCFSAEIPTPTGFSREKHPWFGYHLAGVGKRLATAFAQHFCVDPETPTTTTSSVGSNSLDDLLMPVSPSDALIPRSRRPMPTPRSFSPINESRGKFQLPGIDQLQIPIGKAPWLALS